MKRIFGLCLILLINLAVLILVATDRPAQGQQRPVPSECGRYVTVVGQFKTGHSILVVTDTCTGRIQVHAIPEDFFVGRDAGNWRVIRESYK